MVAIQIERHGHVALVQRLYRDGVSVTGSCVTETRQSGGAEGP